MPNSLEGAARRLVDQLHRQGTRLPPRVSALLAERRGWNSRDFVLCPPIFAQCDARAECRGVAEGCASGL